MAFQLLHHKPWQIATIVNSEGVDAAHRQRQRGLAVYRVALHRLVVPDAL